MITISKEIEKDWYLIELEGTQYYQVWNKWELFELLLESGVTLSIDDFPMNQSEFDERFQKMKELREYNKQLNKK